MIKLIKYEFIKKYRLIAITIIASITLNIYLITRSASGGIAFLSLFPMIMGVLFIVDIIKMYSDDLNKKSGYMLFMTPNSGYKIIVSKMITAVIEGLAILLLYFIFIIINGAYMTFQSGVEVNFNDIIYIVNNIISGSFGFNLAHIFVFMLTVLLFLISFLTTIYTAMTIRKSIFSETKFGGVLSFVIFLLLNWGISFVSSKLFNVLDPYYYTFDFSSQVTASELAHTFLPMNILSIVQIILLTLCSGYLLEKKINL
jgi:hypothetical protein